MPAHTTIDWNDYRFFLAAAEAGSLSGAARRLRVTQPTVGRRLAELEGRLNARLFDRHSEGLTLTAAGERILDLVHGLERTTLAIEREVAGADDQLEGAVVVAAPEGIAATWLAPRLPALRARYPKLELELAVGMGAIDLLRREADIALRVGSPGGEDIVGRRLGTADCGLFASDIYLEAHGEPRTRADLAHHQIIESTGEIESLRQVELLRDLAGKATVALRCNHVFTQLAACRAGLGLLALPLYMQALAPDLRRVLPDAFRVELDLWLLTNRDLRHTGKIRAVLDVLSDQIRAEPLFRQGS